MRSVAMVVLHLEDSAHAVVLESNPPALGGKRGDVSLWFGGF